MRALALLLHTFSFSLLAESKSSHSPRCATKAFVKPDVGRDIQILSVHAQPQRNVTTVDGGHLLPALEGLEFCQVQVYLRHTTQADVFHGVNVSSEKVLVDIWLPLTAEDWNGRLQTTGGAGFATGMFGAHLGIAIKNGWAAVSTDGGHDADLRNLDDASWASSTSNGSDTGSGMPPRGNLHWHLLYNFASRSLVDQVMIGKDITRQYFGTDAHHTYFNGCSTGGRHGYALAQKYPELLDGILANAPAMSFVNLVLGDLWPQVVMKEHNVLMSACELAYFQSQAIAACQAQEPVKNGILESPSNCDWDPRETIGKSIECDSQTTTVTKDMAEVVAKIREGPRGPMSTVQFPGLPHGASMAKLAKTITASNGSRTASPFLIAVNFIRDIAAAKMGLEFADLNVDSFNALWVAAQYELGGLLNTDDPDLSRLRDSGTKMLTWHGADDELIPYQNTINYRRKAEALMGGAAALDEYYRVFLAPGVAHCGGGTGPVPQDPLDALVRWVEKDEPPEILDALIVDEDGDLVTKELCLWPATSKYLGIGDPKRASSWTCEGATERPAKVEDHSEPWSQLRYVKS